LNYRVCGGGFLLLFFVKEIKCRNIYGIQENQKKFPEKVAR
jgi:hypothetical protein